jgi:hypothetical protein
MSDRINVTPLTAEERAQVSGGIWKKNGVIPGYTAPTVLYDDGINIQTTDPSTTNVITQLT